MKQLLLLVLSIIMFTSCDPAISEPTPDMNGRWVIEGDNPSIMYIYTEEIRYTYNCAYDDCREYFRLECEAGDSNTVESNNYTFENNILTIDLNNGSEFVTQVIFDCDGKIVTLLDPFAGYSLYKLGTECQ